MNNEQLVQVIKELERKAGRHTNMANTSAEIGGDHALLAEYHGGRASGLQEAVNILRHLEPMAKM